MARRMTAAAACCVIASWTSAPLADPAIVTGLRLLDSVRLYDKSQGMTEPSGIALAGDGHHYWTVSDETSSLFQITVKGALKPSRTVKVGVKGLEGVAEDTSRRRVLAVAENTAEVVSLSLDTDDRRHYPLNGMDGFTKYRDLLESGGANDGLEGITVGPSSVFLLKEKHQRLLIEVSEDLTQLLSVTELTASMGFTCDGVDDATLDVSDVTWDAQRNRFWIVSDTGVCVFLYDPQGKTAVSFKIPGPADKPKTYIKHPEGIALTAEGDGLLLVTDDGKDSRLYTLAIE